VQALKKNAKDMSKTRTTQFATGAKFVNASPQI